MVNNEEPERSAKTNVPTRGRATAKKAKQAGGGKRWCIRVTFLESNRFSRSILFTVYIFYIEQYFTLLFSQFVMRKTRQDTQKWVVQRGGIALLLMRMGRKALSQYWFDFFLGWATLIADVG